MNQPKNLHMHFVKPRLYATQARSATVHATISPKGGADRTALQSRRTLTLRSKGRGAMKPRSVPELERWASQQPVTILGATK